MKMCRGCVCVMEESSQRWVLRFSAVDVLRKEQRGGEKRELWRVRPNQTKKARNTIDTGFVPKDATLAIGIRHSNGTFGSFFFFLLFLSGRMVRTSAYSFGLQIYSYVSMCVCLCVFWLHICLRISVSPSSAAKAAGKKKKEGLRIWMLFRVDLLAAVTQLWHPW